MCTIWGYIYEPFINVRVVYSKFVSSVPPLAFSFSCRSHLPVMNESSSHLLLSVIQSYYQPFVYQQSSSSEITNSRLLFLLLCLLCSWFCFSLYLSVHSHIISPQSLSLLIHFLSPVCISIMHTISHLTFLLFHSVCFWHGKFVRLIMFMELWWCSG